MLINSFKTSRSSRLEVFFEIRVLKNFAKFTEKTPAGVSFLIKLKVVRLQLY